MVEAIKNMIDVIFVLVLASPAMIGMNAFTEGMSFPKKMYHRPRFEKVSWRALCTLVNVASSIMRSLRARGLSYFLMSKNVTILPMVLPRAPAIIVGIKRSDPVLTKYPQMTYKN